MTGGGSKLVIGTRGSRLALAQTGLVAAALGQLGIATELKAIRTSGDLGVKLPSGSAIGAFVREIEQALLRGEIDLAVHSLKDLPTDERPGLKLAAVPERADPRDALVTRDGSGLSVLPPHSRIATSSPRRAAQLQVYRPDFSFVDVRGNVDTRLRKLAAGKFDALVVAYAGLLRLGLGDQVSEIIPYDICLPAPGQGALAVQVREGEKALEQLASGLDHPPSRLAVNAERAFLARLGVGCSLPAGAVGVVEGERLWLRGAVADEKSRLIIRKEVRGPAQEAESLGRTLGEEMLEAGAREILAEP